jgi:hypothetical protein
MAMQKKAIVAIFSIKVKCISFVQATKEVLWLA